MTDVCDFTLNRQVDAMTDAQRHRALNSLIHTAVFQAAMGDDDMERQIRQALEAQK